MADQRTILAKKWIEQFEGRTEAGMQAICRLILKPTTTEETGNFVFQWRQHASTLKLAIRAEAPLRLPAAELYKLSLDDTALWWLLAALPPEEEYVRILLQLDREQRAVFGLCTPDEREELRRDVYLKQRINDCRPIRTFI